MEAAVARRLPEPPPPRAIRLTFSFGPDGIQLIDSQTIEKRVPASDPLPAEFDATTVAAEARTADEAPTFRAVIPQAIPRDVEVFDPDLPGGVRRDPSPPASGVFTVLIPEHDGAEHVVLLARPRAADVQRDQPDQEGPVRDEQGARPVEVARFELPGRTDGNG
jgi:hypothetical protein